MILRQQTDFEFYNTGSPAHKILSSVTGLYVFTVTMSRTNLIALRLVPQVAVQVAYPKKFAQGATPFNEEAYVHYAAVFSTLYLFRTIYTSASGSIDGLLGEELLDWLNHNYVAPSTEEGVALVEQEKPWLDKNFWNYITRSDVCDCVSNAY